MPSDYQLLDPAKVRSTRIRHGISELELARTLGVSGPVIGRIERGSRQNQLTVTFIHELAEALGVTLGDLLPDAPQDAGGGDPDVVDDTDMAVVGALLTEHGNRVDIDNLAEACGWTLERALIALHALHQQLPAVGQRLSILAGRSVTIVPAVTPRTVAADTARLEIAANGLNIDDARFLHHAITRGSTLHHRHTNPVTHRRLHNAGLLEDTADTGRRTPSGRAANDGSQLTDLARHELVLGEPPHRVR